MIDISHLEAWFITGSQHLYGPETLEEVARHSQEIVQGLAGTLPIKLVYKPVLTGPSEITKLVQEANNTPNCVGLIAWMHTFSPAKMWINGLKILNKPLAHLHTQYNRDLPWDGTTFGRLKVAGFAVAKAYFRSDEPILDDRGFFDTGDVATIDEHGYMAITDRSKDVIKSGGEWISSIDLENLAVGHPDVAEAAVIGVQHPKWDERPLLIVVPKEGRTPDKADILAYMAPRIAKWWMPDDVVVVQAIPHTATGKIQKTALRDQFRDYRLPGAA